MAEALDHLKTVAVADVYKSGRLAAELRRAATGVTFVYRDDYDGPPVATTLPVGAAPVVAPAGAVPPFFAGLLPEGRRLTAIRQAIKTSADDELSILLAVGADAIGDVQVVPAGATPEWPEPAFDVTRFESIRFPDLLERAFVGRHDRVGIPGVQDKVSGRMISAPVRGETGSYLLKLDPPEFPHLVENEAFFFEAARAAGIPVADTRVVEDRDGRKGLLVARFDRYRDDEGTLRMRAQEDACQTLARYPADKYALTTEAVAESLSGLCRARQVAARDLLRLVAFAYVTGNGDAHSKNFSIVRDGDEWRVAPGYDLPSTHPYGDTTLALSINGKSRENVTRRDFHALGGHLKLPPRAVDRTLDRIVASTDEWLPDLERLPFDRQRIHRIRRFVLDRAGKLA